MSAWDGLFRQIKRNPDGYRWFGPWWYSVKWPLRQDGSAMGHNDDPEMRKLMDARAGNDPKRIVRMAMAHDQVHAGNFEDGQTAMLDGTPYYINDTEDVLRASPRPRSPRTGSQGVARQRQRVHGPPDHVRCQPQRRMRAANSDPTVEVPWSGMVRDEEPWEARLG